MTSRKSETVEQATKRQEIERGAKALEQLNAAVEADSRLEIPPPVTEVKRRHHSLPPKMSAEAFELARQVYYLQHGNLPDCARAIIDAGLSDTDNMSTVRERLRSWWKREKWPKRSFSMMVAVRDANFDGGLYRGDKCKAPTTGNGVAPAGKPCGGTRLADSPFCWQHDPRPEYAERRRRQAEKLTALRQTGMVPLGPFKKFCERKAKQLLAEKRRSGYVHHNSTGWGLLADAMGVNISHLKRLMEGKHTDPKRPAVTKIKAKTVARYVKPLGLTFEDIYGKPPPEQIKYEPNKCPECGGYKCPESKKCRTCYEAEKKQCLYVNSFGKRCEVKTRDESGYCCKCREIVFREPKPRYVKPNWIAENILLHALDEFRRNPNLAWVARVLWQADVAGVTAHYKRRRTLAGQLVKEFRHRGWVKREDVETAYWVMVAEQGEPQWPEADGEISAAGLVPVGPFNEWLAARKEELDCSYKDLGARIGMHPDEVSRRIRGVRPCTGEMRRAVVDEVLERWGDGTTFEDLYVGARA